MNSTNEALAREFLKTLDAQGDLLRLLADDVEMSFPKWGVARGKAEVVRFFQDIGSYLRAIRHDPDSFDVLSDGDRVHIEGLSSGQLVDGKAWQPDGQCAGRFCTSFRIRGGLINRFSVYVDPDYTDQTAGFYPWLR